MDNRRRRVLMRGLYFSTTRHRPSGGGGFTPASITGLIAWYDANAITGQADNTSLSAWPDMSGNSYDLAQATGAKQPTYYSSTSGKTINSKPAVWFDGTDDWMVAGSTKTLQPVTAFAVVQLYQTGQITIIGSSTNSGPFDIEGNAGKLELQKQQIAACTDSVATVPATTSVVGVTYDGSAGVNGTTATYYINSHTADSSPAFAQQFTAGAVQLGANGATQIAVFNGPIAEVVIYNNVIGATDRQSLVNYLGTKWGVTVT